MSKPIEIEVRGLLKDREARRLEILFKKQGRFRETKERILIDYSFFLPDGKISDRKRDIRLRVTNKIPEIIIKVGKWGANENRREVSVKTPEGTFDKLVQIFGLIGLTKGALCIRMSKVYIYRDIEFSIVTVPGHSKYFEAEKMVSGKSDRKKVYQEIVGVCQELGLKPFSHKEFIKYVELLNREVNETFDFNQYKRGYFKKRFRL